MVYLELVMRNKLLLVILFVFAVFLSYLSVSTFTRLQTSKVVDGSKELKVVESVIKSTIDGVELSSEPYELSTDWTTIYVFGKPYRLYVELPKDPELGARLVMYSQSTISNQGIVISDEPSWPCITNVLTGSNNSGDVSIYIKYLCGDTVWDRVLRVTLKKDLNNEKTIYVENVDESNLVSTYYYEAYFDGNYNKSPIKVLGWLDTERLIVQQLNYQLAGEGNEFSERLNFLNEQIYLFNVVDKSKQLINYNENPVEESW